MDKNQKRAGIMLSYVTELVKILTSLIYTPIMLRLLGTSEYGLYQLVYSVVSYLGLLNFGFGSAYMRFYSRHKVKGEDEGIARLNGMFLTIFMIISVICIMCGTAMVFNVKVIFGAGLTDVELDKAKVLMALMVLNLALTFPNSVFNSSVTAHEQFIFQKLLALLQALSNPFLALPLLIMGYGSTGMVLVTTFLTIGVLVSNIVFCFKKLKIHFVFKGFKWSLFKEMFVFTSFLFLNQIIDQINWSVDRFLLGRIVGTTSVAIYGVGSLLNSLYIQFSKSISNVFVPQVNSIVAEDNDNQKLTKLFTKVGRMQFLVLALIMTGIVFMGAPFINMWAGEVYKNAYLVALLLIIPETVPLIQNIGIEIQIAKNMHRARSILYFLMAILNVVISIPLIKLWGEVGAAIGTTISLILANILFMNWYYEHKVGLDMKFFWKNILSMCKGLIIPVGVMIVIVELFDISKMVNFIIAVAAYSCVYAASMWFLGMNEQEKKQVLSIVNKFIK